MFIKDLHKFRKSVEKTIRAFFKSGPDGIEGMMKFIQAKWGPVYDLDTVEYKDVRTEAKDDVLAYRTMKYFHFIWSKLMELEDFVMDETGGLKND